MIMMTWKTTEEKVDHNNDDKVVIVNATQITDSIN